MQVIESPQEFRRWCDQNRADHKRIGFVPTMGALHQGHLALIDKARERADAVCVSIFVNPTQFGPTEDLGRYPRDLAADVQKCDQHGALLVFAPEPDQMYPLGEQTRVTPGRLAETLCGSSRPGHFEGVCTIVTKLLNLVGPCRAVFGRKDYQQFKIIERMVRDLLLPVELIAHPIVREQGGLALSSRNRFLTPEARRSAGALSSALNAGRELFLRGERRVSLLEQGCRDLIRDAGLDLEYASVVHADTLLSFDDERIPGDRALFALAASAGSTRLIDNLVLGEDPEISKT